VVIAARLGLLAVAGYWVLVLVPASAEYVTNPASLAYRGPDRLASSLMSYGPTSVAIALGACAIALGAVGEIVRRRADGYVVLLAWFAIVWGALAYSIVSGAATDYPRFATVLLVPLVVAAAGAVTWFIGAFARSAREMVPALPRESFVIAVVVLLTAISTPFAVQRFGRQAVVYQPRDAQALTSAALAIQDALAGQPGTVLTDVRDGKWVEGLTGRGALFSLPVRYAFRPTEWQRSVDADALLRSTTTITSGLVSAMYINQRELNGSAIPTDLLLRVNHGGEFVDMLRINSGAIAVGAGKRQWTTVNGLAPVRATQGSNARLATVTTVWQQPHQRISFTQRATAWKDGAALGVRRGSPHNRLRATLSPPAGSTWNVTDLSVNEATICLPPIGEAPPCARVWVGHPDASLSMTESGDLRVATTTDGRIDLLVTALSAGKASVGLGLIDPAQVLAERDVRAALLWRFDPSFQDRVSRLEDLGFRMASSIGPYQILLRRDAAMAPGY